MRGRPCQDSSGYFIGRDYAVIAVADGHGNDRHYRSEIGSRNAIESLFESVSLIMKRGKKALGLSDSVTISGLKETIVSIWRKKNLDYQMKNGLSVEEQKRILGGVRVSGEYVHRDMVGLGTTLLGAIITNDYIFFIQIGDGDSVYFDRSGVLRKNFMPVDECCDGDQTSSLCADDATDYIRTFCCSGENKPEAVFLCTDGYSNSFDEDEFEEHVSGIVATSCLDERWYGSVANQLDLCASNGSSDDCSIAVAVNTGVFLKSLYEKTFKSDYPVSEEVLSVYPKSLIIYNGVVDGWDTVQDCVWTTEYGHCYRGTMRNGVPSACEFMDESGRVILYEGSFEQYERNGKGIEQSVDGSKSYCGCFKNGKYEDDSGSASLTISTKGERTSLSQMRRYEGSFHNGTMHGMIREYLDNVMVFKGNYHNGLRFGLGTDQRSVLVEELNGCPITKKSSEYGDLKKSIIKTEKMVERFYVNDLCTDNYMFEYVDFIKNRIESNGNASSKHNDEIEERSLALFDVFKGLDTQRGYSFMKKLYVNVKERGYFFVLMAMAKQNNVSLHKNLLNGKMKRK